MRGLRRDATRRRSDLTREAPRNRCASPGSSISPLIAGATTVGTATVTGNDLNDNPSAGFTPTAPGYYYFYASYSGDSADNAVSSSCSGGATTAWSATAIATGSSTAGSSVATASFAVSPSTNYLLLVSRASAASDAIRSISSTGLSPALTTTSFTSISSQSFAGSGGTDYDWAQRLYTGSSETGTATITVTFADSQGAGQSSLVALVAVGGINASNPLVSANLADANGISTTASATLPSAAASPDDASIVMLSSDGNLGSGAPTASGYANVTTASGTPLYIATIGGSLGVYDAVPLQQAASFSPFASQGWGTIAVELRHG